MFAPFPSSCVSLSPQLQVAIIAGNFDLAEIIKVHKASDVGKLTAVVVYHQFLSTMLYRFKGECFCQEDIRLKNGWVSVVEMFKEND